MALRSITPINHIASNLNSQVMNKMLDQNNDRVGKIQQSNYEVERSKMAFNHMHARNSIVRSYIADTHENRLKHCQEMSNSHKRYL
ncbi:hypothetical protein CS022_13080 [Veronia nyctiphanis]|uniref:Uncharacterized protein n=1 Tax=Veronia nyctiphanis TaxID=1278244 RepID=A0A4Q0YRQ2_9GAMM|nr:hypothetical protein CS022_13080 [Veronia nyctiphanis]